MNNTELFEAAEIEIVSFEAEDIIRTSTGAFPGEEEPLDIYGNFVRP